MGVDGSRCGEVMGSSAFREDTECGRLAAVPQGEYTLMPSREGTKYVRLLARAARRVAAESGRLLKRIAR